VQEALKVILETQALQAHQDQGLQVIKVHVELKVKQVLQVLLVQ
jgi:hypothetical protein